MLEVLVAFGLGLGCAYLVFRGSGLLVVVLAVGLLGPSVGQAITVHIHCHVRNNAGNPWQLKYQYDDYTAWTFSGGSGTGDTEDTVVDQSITYSPGHHYDYKLFGSGAICGAAVMVDGQTSSVDVYLDGVNGEWVPDPPPPVYTWGGCYTNYTTAPITVVPFNTTDGGQIGFPVTLRTLEGTCWTNSTTNHAFSVSWAVTQYTADGMTNVFLGPGMPCTTNGGSANTYSQSGAIPSGSAQAGAAQQGANSTNPATGGQIQTNLWSIGEVIYQGNQQLLASLGRLQSNSWGNPLTSNDARALLSSHQGWLTNYFGARTNLTDTNEILGQSWGLSNLLKGPGTNYVAVLLKTNLGAKADKPSLWLMSCVYSNPFAQTPGLADFDPRKCSLWGFAPWVRNAALVFLCVMTAGIMWKITNHTLDFIYQLAGLGSGSAGKFVMSGIASLVGGPLGWALSVGPTIAMLLSIVMPVLIGGFVYLSSLNGTDIFSIATLALAGEFSDVVGEALALVDQWFPIGTALGLAIYVAVFDFSCSALRGTMAVFFGATRTKLW